MKNRTVWLIVAGVLGVGAVGLAALVGIVLLVRHLHSSAPPLYLSDVYRVPGGDYELSTPLVGDTGKKSTDRSALIPLVRIAAANASIVMPSILWYASEGVTVERIEAGKAPEVRPFKDAVGLGRWLTFTIVSERLAQVKVTNLTDGSKDVRYILHVPRDRPALISGSSGEVEKADAILAKRSGILPAMQRIDDYAAGLRKAFGEESGLVGEFADQVRPVEQSWLTGSGDPGAEVEKKISAFAASVTDGDPTETFYLLGVIHGDAMSKEQIAQARKLFGVAISDGPKAARAAPAARLLAVLTCLLADDLPDDFEGLVRMLRWVTEDVRGPIVVREWSAGNTYYIEYLYFHQKGDELRRYVAEQFRLQKKDRPAAGRLREVIRTAAKPGGPFNLYGEHVYNLDYLLDMRKAPDNSSYRSTHGYQVNAPWFWKKMLERHPDLFDQDNRQRILGAVPQAPIVNYQWLKTFPMHAGYKGQKLHHHHIGRGPLATAVPEVLHLKHQKPPL